MARTTVPVAAFFALASAGLATTAHASDPPKAPAQAAPADDGQWTIPQKNFAATRYSELSKINADTVKNLQVAFTFSLGVNRGQGGSPYPNILYTLDLTKPGAPLKWQYNARPEAAAQGVACCDVVNRGPTYANSRVFFTTLDAQVVAVDAETGNEVWKKTLGNIKMGETMTMAPLIVENKVIVGISGGEYGVRGFIEALDAGTGDSVWKAYSTGPDKEVLIGPAFKPHYPSDKGTDLGVTTWPPDAWKQGGGGVWGFVSNDPELNLIYYGAGNPGPWNANQRPGDNKWTNGVFARDPDTGEAKWYYQWNPHDMFD